MAADVPDARSLESWQEAFQHPIPTVRRVEQELRRDIVSNKEKLRSLVGVRYRDLLGTAQTIVEMNEQIQQVESNLADIGSQSNSRIVVKKSAHLHKLNGQKIEEVAEERSLAAQLTLLHNCTSAISRLVRTRSSSVLAAKLLVVSRLLYNALKQNKTVPPLVDHLRSQLASLRRTLLKRLDRQMVSIDSTTSNIVESMCAFCLAESSSFEGVIHHFHNICGKAIESRLARSHSTEDSIVDGLNLYIRTLQRTAELLSGRLSDALGRLTARPIMSDAGILNMGELGIDVLQSRISNDIKHFTPWIKHNNLSKPEAENIMKVWSKKSFEKLCGQAANLLSSSHDFDDLVSLRKRLLEAWLPVQYSTPTHSSLEIVQGIRDLINTQLISILRAQSEGLTSLGDEISSMVGGWSEAENGEDSSPSLWSADLVFLDFSEGAATFKEELVNRMLGKSSRVLRVLESFHTWTTSMHDRQSIIAELRRETWDDVVEDDEDEDSEDVGDILTEDDPYLLQEEHEASLLKGFTTLHASLHRALADINGPHRAQQSGFILRVVREIRRTIPNAYLEKGGELFAHDLVPKLHDILVSEIVTQLRPSLLTRPLKSRRRTCPGRTLWEGDPQLPVQPSPTTFKFFRELMAAMEMHGQDLWNRDAVIELKTQVVKHLTPNIHSALVDTPGQADGEEASAEGLTSHQQQQQDNDDQDKPVVPDTDILQDHKTQLLFDLLYLKNALALRDKSDKRDSMNFIIDTLKGEPGHCKNTTEVLETRAEDYWDRTQLLFGLLA